MVDPIVARSAARFAAAKGNGVVLPANEVHLHVANLTIQVPPIEIPAAVNHVKVNLPAHPAVNVNVPQQPSPVVNVQPAPPPPDPEPSPKDVSIERDARGHIVSAHITEQRGR